MSEGEENFKAMNGGRFSANKSPNAKKIKKKLEELGHTNVFVWYEPLGPAMEMEGPQGGFMYCSDQRPMEPIGYTFVEAFAMIQNIWHRADYRQ